MQRLGYLTFPNLENVIAGGGGEGGGGGAINAFFLLQKDMTWNQNTVEIRIDDVVFCEIMRLCKSEKIPHPTFSSTSPQGIKNDKPFNKSEML